MLVYTFKLYPNRRAFCCKILLDSYPFFISHVTPTILYAIVCKIAELLFILQTSR